MHSLGRQLESTDLNLIAAEAQRLGARRLTGEYVSTEKNDMVKGHCEKFGFTPVGTDASGTARAALDLGGYVARDTLIDFKEG